MRALWYFVGRCVLAAALAAGLTSAAMASAAPEKPSELFKSGIARYAAGRPEEALDLFESPALAGKDAPGIYYNIGNAAYVAGRIGKAIWAYERALLLDPRARDIRKNIARARSRAADMNGGAPPTNFFEGISSAFRWVSGREAAWVFSGFWAAWILALAFRFFAGWWAAAGVALFRSTMILVIMAGSVLAVKVADDAAPRAVICADEVSARFGPAAADGKAFALKEGRMVRILNSSEEWWFVVDAEGRSGWIPRDAALRVDREFVS